MDKVKVAFIGAGSYGFTLKLVVDILSFEALAGCRLSFMDVDKERLDNCKILIEEYLYQNGLKNETEYTLNMEQALEGADFVINLVKIGFLEMSNLDMDIPKKYGLYQTIGDTCGVGGVFRGLRTMVFNRTLLSEMEKRSSSKAVVLNYTNPQSMTVMAASMTSRIPFIGLCHSVQGTTRQIGKLLGVPYEELDYEAGGINHMNWITKLEANGKDLYPQFRQYVMENGIYSESEGNDDVFATLGPTRLDMLLRTGYMVTESSTHFPEYVPFYLRNKELIDRYKLIIDKYKQNIANKEKNYKGYVEAAKKHELPEFKRSVEYGSSIINSMVTDNPSKVYANVMNTGLITNLPEFSAVEVACLVDRNGVHPCHYGALPTHLAALCQSNISVHQLAVEAFLNKDKKSIVYALMADPLTHSVLTLDQMEKVVDELVSLQQEYLGEYFK